MQFLQMVPGRVLQRFIEHEVPIAVFHQFENRVRLAYFFDELLFVVLEMNGKMGSHFVRFRDAEFDDVARVFLDRERHDFE